METVTKIKHIAFDVSGTLQDDRPVSYAALAQIANENGYRIPRSNMLFTSEWVANQPADSAPKLLEKAGMIGYDHNELQEMFANKVIDVCNEKPSQLYEGIKPLLQKLIISNIRISAISAHPHQAVISDFRNNGILNLFEHIQGDLHGWEGKVDCVRKIMNNKGYKNSEVIIVGDGAGDIKAANALNINSIGVTYGGYPGSKHLAEEKPTSICNSIRMLEKRIMRYI